MYKRSAPESPDVSENLVAMAQAIAVLTTEQIQNRISQNNAQALQQMITAIEGIFSYQASLFQFFRAGVGYPSDEDALAGIRAYASGKIRRLEHDLFDEKIPEFLRIMDSLSSKPVKQADSYASVRDEERKQTLENELADKEKKAQQYLALQAVKPKLEARLAVFMQALSRLMLEGEQAAAQLVGKK